MYFFKRTLSFLRTGSRTAKSFSFPRTFEAASERSEEINSSISMDLIDQGSTREILRNGLDPDDPKVKLPETAEPKYESDFIKAERRKKEERRGIKIRLGIVELGPISFLESIKSDSISSFKLQSEMMREEIEPNYEDPMESPIVAPELRRGISQEERQKKNEKGIL